MHTTHRRSFVLAAAILIGLTSSIIRTSAQLQEDPVWRIGDVFAGVGWLDYLSGQYWVFDHSGQPKLLNGAQQKVVDTWKKVRGLPQGVTTGCVVAPGGDLYTTSFHGLTVARFDALPPHSRSGEVSISYRAADPDGYGFLLTDYQGQPWEVIAIESIVFDATGRYYVGGQGPYPESATDEPFQKLRPGFIFQYGSDHVRQAVYEVPIGNRGVDQLDLGSNPDYSTFYYTSEDTILRVFRPWMPVGPKGPGQRWEEIQVRDNGISLQGSLYAVRALPPLPDPPEMSAADPLSRNRPSGFLVASSSDVLRLDPQGNIIRRYVMPGTTTPTQRFALNITPDGHSFWTATYRNDPSIPPSQSHLIKFHIPTATPLHHRLVDTADIWGLCVVKEYTAGINTCYQMDATGAPIEGTAGPCPIPPNCLPGDLSEACRLPGAPAFPAEIADTTNTVGDLVGYPAPHAFPLATSPVGSPLAYTVRGQPAGIEITDANRSTGLMTGTVTAAPGVYTVTVTVSDAQGRAASTSFEWTIVQQEVRGNTPPVLEPHPGGSEFTVTVGTAHQLTYWAVENPDNVLVAARFRRSTDASFIPGLPPNYSLLHTVPQGGYTPPVPLPVGYQLLGMLPGGRPDGRHAIVLSTESRVVPELTTYFVSLAIIDTPAGSQWGDYDQDGIPDEQQDPNPQLPLRDWRVLESQNQHFTIEVVNRRPTFLPTPLPNRADPVGESLAYQLAAHDADGHPLTFSATGLPEGLSMSAGGLISGPPGLPTGEEDEHTSRVSVTVTDGWETTTLEFDWRVYTNNPPVCSAAHASLAVIWPPNHRLVPITILGVTDADGDPIEIAITGIQQDEPVDTQGSGKTVEFDGAMDGATALVRAERTGVKATPGNGRLYYIRFQASDGKDSCTGTVVVGVPHDQGQRKSPLPNQGRWDSLTGAAILPADRF